MRGRGGLSIHNRWRRLFRAALTIAALSAAVTACSDAAISVTGPDASDGTKPLDLQRLEELRALGEGCGVTTRDAAHVVRGFAVPRAQLPFAVPAIQRDPVTGLGNGVVRRIVVEREGERVTLNCWLPKTLTSQQLVTALDASQKDDAWGAMFASLEDARALPQDRGTLSPEVRQFRAELLGLPAARSATSADYYESCEPLMTNRRPSKSARFDCSMECLEFEVLIYFNGDTWRIEVTGYICYEQGGGGYDWLVNNGYTQFCGGYYPDERDRIINEYDNTSLFEGTWRPSCDDFSWGVTSSYGYFQWSELMIHLDHYWVVADDMIGIFRVDMLTGIDHVRVNYGGPLTLNSVYRCPQRNYNIGSTARQSRHMFGDAVDINTNDTQEHWQEIFNAASQVQGATVLTGAQDPSCALGCVHVDWRP